MLVYSAIASLDLYTADAEGKFDWAEPDEGLWSLVRELPAKQRTALALRYVADAGYDEISTVMGTSEDAARRNVHEALKRLRMEYEQ